jgi:hypothetical protein
MNDTDTRARTRRGMMRIRRSRGAVSGFLLIVLGVWGALIPFFGHHFGFGYTLDEGWTWTAARGWLQVLPGAATAAGGVLLVISQNRATAMLGGWLTVVAGAWFVVGNALAAPLPIDEIGPPVAQSDAESAVLELAYFSGIGTAIVLLGAIAVGRLSVRSLRDIRYAERSVSTPTDKREEPAPESITTTQLVPPAEQPPSGPEPQSSDAPTERPKEGSGRNLSRRQHTPLYFTAAVVTGVRARSYSHIPFPLMYGAPVIGSLALASPPDHRHTTAQSVGASQRLSLWFKPNTSVEIASDSMRRRHACNMAAFASATEFPGRRGRLWTRSRKSVGTCRSALRRHRSVRQTPPADG